MIASHIDDKRRGTPNAERFADLIRHDRPDLTGGLKLVDSPRHIGYVDSRALRTHLAKVGRRMGWRIHGNPPVNATTSPVAVTS